MLVDLFLILLDTGCINAVLSKAFKTNIALSEKAILGQLY